MLFSKVTNWQSSPRQRHCGANGALSLVTLSLTPAESRYRPCDLKHNLLPPLPTLPQCSQPCCPWVSEGPCGWLWGMDKLIARSPWILGV